MAAFTNFDSLDGGLVCHTHVWDDVIIGGFSH
jgi:hypothetical protein